MSFILSGMEKITSSRASRAFSDEISMKVSSKETSTNYSCTLSPAASIKIKLQLKGKFDVYNDEKKVVLHFNEKGKRNYTRTSLNGSSKIHLPLCLSLKNGTYAVETLNNEYVIINKINTGE